MRFVDMAGSERVYEVSTDIKEQQKGIMVNAGILCFQIGCFAAGELKKPLTGGDPIPKNIAAEWSSPLN